MTQKYIICPFYKCQGKLSVRCEGMYDAKYSGISFNSSAEKAAYISSYCMSFGYEKGCEVCRQILKKYDKAEDVKPRKTLIIL